MSELEKSFSTYLRYELNRSPLTVDAYLADLRQFAEFLSSRSLPTPSGNNLSRPEASVFSTEADLLPNASTPDIRAWLSLLSAGGDKPRTLRRKAQSLRAFYRYLMKRRIIKTNPATDITLAKTDKPLPQFVREKEIERILEPSLSPESFTDIRDRLIITLLYTTGMRRAEIIGLRDSDVDLSAMQLKVTGKRSKQRIIPFSDTIAAEIRKYLNMRDNEETEKTGAARDSGIFFTNHGHPVSRSRIAEIVRRMLQGTSVARKSPHVLRHTFATVMLNHGAEINSVKELLGHASIATTQIYTHLSFAELRKSYFNAHPRERTTDKKRSQ